jgi:hypothetical protein
MEYGIRVGLVVGFQYMLTNVREREEVGERKERWRVMTTTTRMVMRMEQGWMDAVRGRETQNVSQRHMRMALASNLTQITTPCPAPAHQRRRPHWWIVSSNVTVRNEIGTCI